MRYALVGYGRMGRSVETEAERRGHRLTVRIDPRTETERCAPVLEARVLEGTEVAFEFSEPAAAEANVVRLLDAGVGVVCGTTGWKPSAALERAARESAAGAVIAPNFSVGMNLFYRIVESAARLYGGTGLYHPYVFEAHHRGKRDVPSGTARRLADLLLAGDKTLRRIQQGNPPDAMGRDTLHVASLRAGSEPGTHVVGFDGEYDRITLQHAARSRAGFALGAVLAAEWVCGRRGLHEFDAVLEDLLAGQAPRDSGAREPRRRGV